MYAKDIVSEPPSCSWWRHDPSCFHVQCLEEDLGKQKKDMSVHCAVLGNISHKSLLHN
jgi:hypothetical protein